MSSNTQNHGRDPKLEAHAKVLKYADGLLDQWGRSVRAFNNGAADGNDLGMRLQTSLHVLTMLHQQQVMRCLEAGIPYHKVMMTVSGGLLNAGESVEAAIQQRILLIDPS